MTIRIISGVVGVALLCLVLCLNTLVFDAVLAIVAAIAVCELFRAVGIGRFKSLKAFSVLAVASLMISLVYSQVFVMLIVYIYIFLLFMLFMTKVEGIGYKHISKAFMATMFITVCFGHLSILRCWENGRLNVLVVFIISFLTDTFAYFTGRFVGRHKLSPNLSPKKTIEGAFGGLVGAIAGMLVYCAILNTYFGIQAVQSNAIIVAIIGSVISQLGDLAASAIKRQYGIKDYGKIMPGHGGVMDRFDGVLFTAPAVYYLMVFFPII